eukprot:29658-Pelagococcus_subviridis.AAC.7
MVSPSPPSTSPLNSTRAARSVRLNIPSPSVDCRFQSTSASSFALYSSSRITAGRIPRDSFTATGRDGRGWTPKRCVGTDAGFSVPVPAPSNSSSSHRAHARTRYPRISATSTKPWYLPSLDFSMTGALRTSWRCNVERMLPSDAPGSTHASGLGARRGEGARRRASR